MINKIKDNKKINSRIHYLDALRGILMMLGVFYHSSLVFSPTSNWAIHSDDTTLIALYLESIISFFRMPAFFIISGYFVLFTILKYGPDLFIRVRLKRILIPLFSTAVTLNIIQAVLVKGSDWQIYYLDQGWVTHLWFLWNLVFYFVFVYMIFNFFDKKKLNFLKKVELKLLKVPLILIMLILPFFSILLLVIGKLLPNNILGIEISSILYYFPFFLFGMLLFRNENLLNSFARINPIVSIVVSIVSYNIYVNLSIYDGNIWLAISLYFKVLSAWFGSAMSFYLFMKFFNKESKYFYFLAEASYTVYLFHQVLVIGFGLVLIKLNIGGILGLVSLITSVLFVSILIHVLFISKIKFLKFLYNGQ